jgi:DNA-binding XRE family transcriptional regulator
MKKLCPDLTALSDDALREFWQQHQPHQLKRLGDRLLAESLPKWEPRSPEFCAPDLAERRQALNLTLNQAALQLGVTPVTLAAWESGEVRPPASLPLIYAHALR